MTWVGASSGRCSYPELQIAFVKNFRSSFLAKPANCETLFSRTSISFFTLAFERREKKPSANGAGAWLIFSQSDPPGDLRVRLWSELIKRQLERISAPSITVASLGNI